MESHAVSPSDLERLRRYDTPTVCNVIELFDIRPRNAGFMDSRIKACFPEMPPIVGYASTATFRSAGPPSKGSAYASLAQQVALFQELPGPPIVVFQDLDDPPAGATFGEIMCTVYQSFGAVGLITSGAGRDLDQVRSIGFPVFCNGAICAHAYCHVPTLHVPVHVGGIAIYPGDLLHGDCNGVTTIPLEIASDVASACEEYIAAEAVVLEYLQDESPTPKGLDEARAESQHLIQALKKRLVH